jgi:hypothetical protein
VRWRLGTLLLAASVAGGCGAHQTARPARQVERGDGIRYVVPAGWHVARRSLTPHLGNPKQALTVSTGPLPAGGRCAHMPSAALAEMTPQDVLVAVQERFGDSAGFPARPAHFTLAPDRSEAEECAGPNPAFVSHWSEFRDGGRGFHVLVAVGTSAPATRVAQALAVLDSLRITPRRPARIDPDEAIPYDSASRGLHLVLPLQWRVYEQPLTQAISSHNQLALGTFPLKQSAPDANCTPTTALSALPRDGGFIFMFEITGGPHALAGIPLRPARLELPGPRPYECFGLSRMVRFRDGNRAFQAHVYGAGARRRQALEILDSLRVQPAPFDESLHAARFPHAAGWRTRISGPAHEGSCLSQRVSWASTVPFRDGAQNLPPTKTIVHLPSDGVVMAAVQARDRCNPLRGLSALQPPLDLKDTQRSDFDGPRGDELQLYRIMGRFPGRYMVDLWVIYGRRTPTAAQQAAAQHELSGVRWPAML